MFSKTTIAYLVFAALWEEAPTLRFAHAAAGQARIWQLD
jgi:hypothetical protein